MRIQLYVLRELLVASCFTLGGILVLALPAVAVSAIHKLPGVELVSVLLYLPLVLAGLVPYVLPLAFLLAVVSSYGRLAADNEWTAMRMTGANPVRVLIPGITLGLALAAPTLWMVGDLLPHIRQKQSGYMVQAMSAAVRNLSPGRTEVQLGDFYLTSRRRDGRGFVDAQVYVPALGGQPERNLRADRIDIEIEGHSVLMKFRNARAVVGGTEVHNGDMTLRIDLDELQERGPGGSTRVRYYALEQLQAELDAGAPPERARELRYEIHARLSLSAAFVWFLLLGAPTGLMLRRGNQLPALAAAVGYALAFYLLHMRLGKQLAENAVLPPELCAWASPVLFLGAGLWLTRKALSQ
jgi:lipopolysaccharide export system permease protein